MQGRSLLGVAGLVLAFFAADADAATIDVRPGPNAIQNAVDRAEPGDKLRVKRGTYREDVVVDKRLRIVGRKGKRPLIDGGCATDRTVDVVADGVRLRHLKVKGARRGPGDGYAVNVIGVERVKLDDLVLRESCSADPAYYGVNAFETGALEITEIKATGGFVDAGIYVGSIGDVGSRPFLVSRNEAFGNNVGILMEDSGPEANFVVRANRVHHNDFPGLSEPAGILVRRSDVGRYAKNRAHANGEYGIHLDSGSDGNVLNRNRAFGNGIANLFDEGSGNCGTGNSFPIAPCP